MTDRTADPFEVLAADCALYRIPLARPVMGASARAGITPLPLTSWELLVVTLRSGSGETGVGFTYAIRAGAHAVDAALRHDVLPLVVGADCREPEALWERMYWATHNVGRRGAYVHAFSAVDIALWDLRARMLGVSLASLLGAERDRVPLYESDFGWLSLSIAEMTSRNAAAVESGIDAVKIFVGFEDPAEDARRVAAVRAAIGPDARLMIDISEKWRMPDALDRIRRLEEYDLYWVEEPLSCDDVRGHRELAGAIDARIATGQTMTTRFEFEPLLEDGVVRVVQADVARLGGVTEWMALARQAAAAGADMVPHFLMELHVGLVAAAATGTYVERTPWLSELLEDPPEIEAGALRIPAGPGHGLRFRSGIEAHRLA